MESFHILNPSESFQWPPRKGMCRERIRGLANLITRSKISFLIASLAFCRFLCVTYRNGLQRGTSKLRHSKYLKKYEPCQFDTFCWETAFYYTRAKGAVTQKSKSVSKITGYHFLSGYHKKPFYSACERFFGKQRFDVKQQKINKFIKSMWQLIISTSIVTLEVHSLRPLGSS